MLRRGPDYDHKTFEWDTAAHGTGKLARSSSADDVATTFAYDPRGLVESVTWTHGASQATQESYTMDFVHDALGRIEEMAAARGERARSGWGKRGRLLSARRWISGEKVPIHVAGRTRIPDGLTRTVLTEVMNVASQSYTQQLRDFAAYARQNGLRFDLWVRPTTELSGPLAEKIAGGAITLRYIP